MAAPALLKKMEGGRAAVVRLVFIQGRSKRVESESRQFGQERQQDKRHEIKKRERARRARLTMYRPNSVVFRAVL